MMYMRSLSETREMPVELVLAGHGEPVDRSRAADRRALRAARAARAQARRPDRRAPAHRLRARPGPVGQRRGHAGLPDAERGARPRRPAGGARRGARARARRRRALRGGCVRIGLLTREYPPEVYGGAGVHVEYLARELAKLEDVVVHAWGSPRPDDWTPPVVSHQAWDALAGDRPELASLRAFSIDLAMAAAAHDGDVVHSHTWYANLAGHLAALTYDVPHVVTTHSLEPQRPWKAEQLGGGYALSTLGRADRAGVRRRGDRRIARAWRATSSRPTRRSTPRASRSSTTASTPTSTRPTRDRGARGPRHRPGPPLGGVRRAHHAPEGRAPPRAARRSTSTRPCSSSCAPARRTRRRSARRSRPASRSCASAATACSGSRRWSRSRDVIQLPQPRDRVRVPVDLRAARDRQPRGDGLRGGGGRERGRRHRRGGRGRRDGDAGRGSSPTRPASPPTPRASRAARRRA